MATPPISSGVTMNTLKSRILNPALTSHYSVMIYPPQGSSQGNNDGEPTLANYIRSEFGIIYDLALMELTCTEANLPGSSLATIETLDYMGVTEKHAYRRLYDDTIDFTFLVTQDSNYQQIRFFDAWLRYIVREDSSRLNQSTFYARARYPSEYKGTLQVVKFEKNLGSRFSVGGVPLLIYNFVDAYPKSINSIPVSYDASDLLKVTVSFTYSRYYVDRQLTATSANQERNQNSPGNPEVPSAGALGTLNPQNNVTSELRSQELQRNISNDSRTQPFNLRGFGSNWGTTNNRTTTGGGNA
jgi:hypothetical protein